MENASPKGKKTTFFTVYDITYIAMSIALITLCSWITVPSTVPFTMQTFAIFAIVALFGVTRATAATLIYLLLGALGAPIFSGFNGGFGYLLGSTGGYLIGFVFASLVTGLMIKFLGNKTFIMFISMVSGLVVCYAIGTAYFMLIYTKNSGPVALTSVFLWCVAPFIVPDLLKILLALFTAKRFSKFVKN
ncbi:MAG: biotin transporter BioY [Clostridiales bacterium]|nr:biotin transporter BioY [Clostridiales bacterium]